MLLSGHPELVILGLDPSHCLDLFTHVMGEVRRGVELPVGRDAPNEADGVPFRLLPVPIEHWAGGDCLLLGFASFYGPRRFPIPAVGVLQLVTPDRNLRFPWDEDAMPRLVRDQRVLDDGDPPTRRWPLERGTDVGTHRAMCCAEPRNRAERRLRARGRG